ncbi:MAG: CHAT domain-containing protein, partial [Parafilimonas sp.]|nr:CHAT domain-containing protein [Parafilimonas sp.]
YASSCNILADLYYFMGRYGEAALLYIEAKKIREKIFTKENAEYAQTCNNLANLYRETGNYKAAEALALEANAIWQKVLTANSPDIANSYENLGLIYNQTKKYRQAENDFLQARNIWKKITTINNPSYTTNAFYLGEVYRNLNQNEKANTYFTESFNAQYDQLKKVFQFTSENEKEQYLQNIKGSVDEYESFYFSRFNYNNASSLYEINLSNRNLILSATEQVKQAINNSGDSILNKKYREWASIKNQLGALYLRKDTGTIVKIPALEEKANDLEKELVRNSVALETALHRDITWQNIQQNLKANEAAVEFSAFNFHDGIKWTDSTYYIALILRKDKPAPQVAFLFEKKKIDSLLNNVDDINALYTQKGLYDVIWKPAEKYLQGVHKIYFAPAADLFKISFAALRVNANEFLSDKYELIQLNTTASVIDRKESFINASDKIQLYGGIEYTTDTTTLKTVAIAYHANGEMSRSLPDDLTRAGSIQYLPATKTEVETIQQQANKSNITVNILSGINATEETFKALNGKASPAIIHIATHGFFFPDPKQNKRDSIQQKFETSGKIFKQSDNPLFRSGLLFAGANIAWQGKNINGIEDGIVTAYDVSNMYLPNTKLVVLSACETALGDIKGSEGVYGLQRAFKIAGVKNLVMSLWKVPDTETSEFMQVFYKKIFDKQPIDAAFFKAQTIMKNKYRNEPYKWAAWILIK